MPSRVLPMTLGSLAMGLGLILASALAACGGASQPANPPNVPGTQPPPPDTSTTADGGAANAPASGGAHVSGGASTVGTLPFSGEMKAPIASAMAADLQAIGLDPKALPPLDKLDPDKLRKVMKTFTKALGAKCTDCHVENDFRASTPRKAITVGMWNHFARELTTDAGALVYCDSCHQGQISPLLDRHDKKALSGWMHTNYVDKFKRVDGKEHNCATCHGDPFDPKFVVTWSQGIAHK